MLILSLFPTPVQSSLSFFEYNYHIYLVGEGYALTIWARSRASVSGDCGLSMWSLRALNTKLNLLHDLNVLITSPLSASIVLP